MTKRTINQQNENLAKATKNGIATCYDSYSNKSTTLDFNSYGFSKQLARAYAISYYVSRNDGSWKSHASNKLALTQIASFHADLKITKLSDITTNQISEITKWLKKPNGIKIKKRSTSYMYGIFSFYKNLVKNIPIDHSTVNSKIRWPSNPFPNKNKSYKPNNTPSDTDYEALYQVMMDEYLFYRERLGIGRDIRHGTNKSTTPLTAAVKDLIANENAYLKGIYPVDQSPSHSLVRKAGGLPTVISYLYPTRKFIAPIYQMLLLSLIHI